MPDRLVVSKVSLDGLWSFSVGGGLEWLLTQLGEGYVSETVAVVTNEKPGEDDDAVSYFVSRYELEAADADRRELLECTCPAFRYQQVPKPEQVQSGVVDLGQIGECKHLEEYRKKSRSYADRDESQTSVDETLDGGSL